ncbi:putative acyltransferase [Gordonia otitidis NBRC 100426]|mgnify:CR=1 FL=1|uniref:diacylglycerol O-acyltransferase n=1 Tax=Gordonia otitidis (strain DSM 44809 / CCUG 52243 / JCM 12355 / NBRC 100426 / IFM 10032) TaxID=1108044 RepID=H5TJA1_GORO1|nr:putative acyltransferase [Gordonia otitidis NBRC 100426]
MRGYHHGVANRLSPREAMSYFLDGAGATNHLGAVLVFAGDSGKKRSAAKDLATTRVRGKKSEPPVLDYPSLVRLVENRLQLVPLYRKVVLEVVLGLARPVWADDPDFDINFHIRRSGLPSPGTMADLEDLVARVMSRPLDRSRPLWEMYLIEGLEDGGFAILTKSHRCLIDGGGAEMSEVICDDEPDAASLPVDVWMPGPPPGSTSLAVNALAEALARPGELIDSVIGGNGLLGEARSVVVGTFRRAGRLVQQLTDSAPSSLLNATGSSTRTFVSASVSRRDVAKIAERNECTVNDVELAIITGAMRLWLLSTGAEGDFGDTVRAVLPLGSRQSGVLAHEESPETWIVTDEPRFVTDLPVGEANPLVRLAQVAGLANRYAQSSRRVSRAAEPLLGELGVVPFAEFSSRAFRSLDRRAYNVPVAMNTVPIPPQYVLGRTVSDLFVVPGLVAGRAMAVGVCEYAGRIEFGFTADRGVIDDLALIRDYVRESYEELADAR